MILSSITSCEGHKLRKLSSDFVHWRYQHVTIENYLYLLKKTIMVQENKNSHC